MVWIKVDNEGTDFINLNHVFRVRIRECADGWHLIGERVDNGKEVVLSQIFESEIDCYFYFKEVRIQS